jgi:hypothetical protein
MTTSDSTPSTATPTTGLAFMSTPRAHRASGGAPNERSRIAPRSSPRIARTAKSLATSVPRQVEPATRFRNPIRGRPFSSPSGSGQRQALLLGQAHELPRRLLLSRTPLDPQSPLRRALNVNGFSAESNGPPGAVRGDGPRGSVASIDPADNVALSVELDDVAWAELVGVDLGHVCPPHSNTSDMFHSCGAHRILTIDEFRGRIARFEKLSLPAQTSQIAECACGGG